MPFANPDRTYIRAAAVVWIEPTAEVSNSFCMRSQRRKCRKSEKFGAVAQRKNWSFMEAATRIRH
ncbi:hypothetical protein RA2_04495 [Roseovarius sp. A-2]|nr:hypothetical protein RA2_04495 [Roseovarius sp. A-2]